MLGRLGELHERQLADLHPRIDRYREVRDVRELERDVAVPTGIDESCRIDRTLHSLFGASKAAADIYAQEYGRYFGLNVGIFRAGCMTGPQHSGVELHGFLSYLVKVAMSGERYTISTSYSGKEAVSNEGGGNYYPVARHNWYPNAANATFGEYSSYDMMFHIPKGMKIAATGTLLNESSDTIRPRISGSAWARPTRFRRSRLSRFSSVLWIRSFSS